MLVIAIASAEGRVMNIGDVIAVFLEEGKMIDEVQMILDRCLTGKQIRVRATSPATENPY
jgi:hypothetical protein